MTDRAPLSLVVNGVQIESLVEARRLLVDYVREDLGLTGTKIGCEDGGCGACTVLLDGEAVRSCLLFAVQVEGHDVETVEGLSSDGRLRALQDAFRSRHALQCGFCAAGMLLTASELLARRTALSEPDVREALSGVLCRCTGYQNIVDAVLVAAEIGRAHVGEMGA